MIYYEYEYEYEHDTDSGYVDYLPTCIPVLFLIQAIGSSQLYSPS